MWAKWIPLGPSLMFLLRDPDLAGYHELTDRAEHLDRPLHLAAAATDAGLLDPGMPPWWAIEALHATVWVAWEQIKPADWPVATPPPSSTAPGSPVLRAEP